VNVERKAEQIARHEASVILLCTKTRRLWGLASIVRSFFFHVMGTTTTCFRPTFIDLCPLLGISFFSLAWHFRTVQGTKQRACMGRKIRQYDALRHRISDRLNYFGSLSWNLWCLIKDFTRFEGVGMCFY
jgi:hypothetical protein